MRRRRLTEASICLAIGVLVTLSIAWTASAVPGVARLAATHTNGWYENADGVWLVSWRDSTLTSRISIWRALEDDDEMWLANRQDMRDMLSAIRAKLGPREVPAWARAGSARWEQVQGFGWPRRAMILGSNERTTFIGPAQIHDGRYVIPESVPVVGGRVLAVIPVWPGLALDVAFFATVSWLVVFGPFALRRLLRANRGNCAECGYDLAGLSTCPECGSQHRP